jgi:hypothetical protein
MLLSLYSFVDKRTTDTKIQRTTDFTSLTKTRQEIFLIHVSKGLPFTHGLCRSSAPPPAADPGRRSSRV